MIDGSILPASPFSAFWVIFSFSFMVALSGAMAPGPLFTYTIIKSAGAKERGYLMGAWIIAGHALLEMAVVLLLLSGFSFLLQDIRMVRIIGVVGGAILIYFGFSIIRDVWQGKISTDFFDTQGQQEVEATAPKGKLENPVVGGVLISMANPYWWVWWATIGLAFMARFEITWERWPRLLAFFLGHEAGDLVWYLIVSTLAFFGLRRLNRRIYYGILVVCGIFMALFGLYLGISPFFQKNIPS